MLYRSYLLLGEDPEIPLLIVYLDLSLDILPIIIKLISKLDLAYIIMTKERQVICGMCGKKANLRHMRACRRNIVKSIVEGRIHNLKIFNGEKTDFERRLLFTAIVIARFKLRLWYEKYRQ